MVNYFTILWCRFPLIGDAYKSTKSPRERIGGWLPGADGGASGELFFNGFQFEKKKSSGGGWR